MSTDIFVPESSAEDALAQPLHTITYVTSDKDGIEKMLCLGLDLESSGWASPPEEDRTALNQYFGFEPGDSWESCVFTRSGVLKNVQILAIHVSDRHPMIRPCADGRYFGGATIGFPMQEMSARVTKMQAAGVASTVGVKELEFTNPEGEVYISREVHFLGMENIFMLGVQRPDALVSVGQIDPLTDIGAPAYSARCVPNIDQVGAFTEQVLGFEIRRDMQMEIGARSGLLMEEGIPERFVQAFAPGSGTGYLVYLEHRGYGLDSPAPSYHSPNRGLTMWSFPTKHFDALNQQALRFGATVIQAPRHRNLPHLGACRTMILNDSSGFAIEIFEV